MPRAPVPDRLLRSAEFNIKSASVAIWSSRSACGPSAGDVSAKEAVLCDEPGAAMCPILRGSVWKGLLNMAAEEVCDACALNAGDAVREDDVTDTRE